MSVNTFFDGLQHYRKKLCFYEQGGSPLLLEKLIETIESEKENILEVNMSWYLYNNRFLHNYLKTLSERGIKVNVITMPLEGYDNSKPQLLEDLFTGKQRKERVTKYGLAKEIFADIYHSAHTPNFNMYFFAHLYVRSPYVNKFSRGALPYSLHVKSAYIKKKSGSMIILSSSNLALRDVVKHESMICIQDEAHYDSAFESFYKDLIRNSIHIKEYHKNFNISCNSFDPIEFKSSTSSFITAPFYTDSANILDHTLTQLILSAKERIIICAQHLAAFNYEFNGKYHSTLTSVETRQGILGAILTMANSKRY